MATETGKWKNGANGFSFLFWPVAILFLSVGEKIDIRSCSSIYFLTTVMITLKKENGKL